MAGRHIKANWLDTARLWLVLDIGAAAPLSLSEVTRLSAAGGVDTVICRIKNEPADIVRRESSAVRNVCRELSVPFIMSHNPDLAVELEADGIQIGISDPGIPEIRAVVGPGMVIGYSTHGVAEAQQCFSQGADYVFLGPIFPTPEKLKYGDPLGIDTVTEAEVLPGPVVFIGGINLDNVGSLVERGVDRVAVISAIQCSSCPETAARNMKRYLIPC